MGEIIMSDVLNKKMSYDEFCKLDFSLTDVDSSYVHSWSERSFFSQMLDAWGEMDFTLKSFEMGKSDEVLQHAKMLHEVCCLIYANPNVFDEEKETLKYAEWEFFNYVLWGSNDKSAVYWFNQWNYDINYDLI